MGTAKDTALSMGIGMDTTESLSARVGMGWLPAYAAACAAGTEGRLKHMREGWAEGSRAPNCPLSVSIGSLLWGCAAFATAAGVWLCPGTGAPSTARTAGISCGNTHFDIMILVGSTAPPQALLHPAAAHPDRSRDEGRAAVDVRRQLQQRESLRPHPSPSTVNVSADATRVTKTSHAAIGCTRHPRPPPSQYNSLALHEAVLLATQALWPRCTVLYSSAVPPVSMPACLAFLRPCGAHRERVTRGDARTML